MYDYCFFSHIVFVAVQKILFRLFYIFCLSPILPYVATKELPATGFAEYF